MTVLPDPEGPVAVAEPSPTPAPVKPSRLTASLDPLDPWASAEGDGGPSATLPLGGTSLYVAGEPQGSSVAASPGRPAGSLVFAAQGWSLEVQSLVAVGEPMPLLPGPALAFASVQGETGPYDAAEPSAIVSGSGLKPGSPVRFYLLPDTYLGQLTTIPVAPTGDASASQRTCPPARGPCR